MSRAAGKVTLTRSETRVQTFLLVFGSLGFIVTLIVYNTTGHWWPMAIYIATYLVLGGLFTVHVLRTRRWSIRQLGQLRRSRRSGQAR